MIKILGEGKAWVHPPTLFSSIILGKPTLYPRLWECCLQDAPASLSKSPTELYALSKAPDWSCAHNTLSDMLFEIQNKPYSLIGIINENFRPEAGEEASLYKQVMTFKANWSCSQVARSEKATQACPPQFGEYPSRLRKPKSPYHRCSWTESTT